MSNSIMEVVELNVGGVNYSTTQETLRKDENSVLNEWFSSENTTLCKDSAGRYFIDRDGVLFRFILDYLRNERLVLPENFQEKERLKTEAEYYKISGLIKSLTSIFRSDGAKTGMSTITTTTTLANDNPSPEPPQRGSGFILVAYRGTFAFGRDGLADVKFRKLSRILVSGRVVLCREAFGDTLNESRDPDRGSDERYTSRFFLKHNSLEQAFDNLLEAGFKPITSCASGTNACGEIKPGMDSEESKWNHFNEFTFYRDRYH